MKSRTNWKQWMRWWRRPSAVHAHDFGDFGTAFGLELSLQSSGLRTVDPAVTAVKAETAPPQQPGPR